MEHGNDYSLLQLALSGAPNLNDGVSAQQNQINDVAVNDAADDKVADLFSQRVPTNASDLTSVDSTIASQMAKLSVTDREQVYMDVHGVSGGYVQETPELIAQSLSNLHMEIDKLIDKRAYEIAERLSPQYVLDPEFRLMFLRCDKFDCAKAALRIIRHFQMKLDLFGMGKLVMDITQDDLDADDMDGLYSSTGRFLEKRDSAGRIINLLVPFPRRYKTDSILRKGFYNIMVAFRDEEVQRRGAVSISILPDGGKDISASNPDLLWKLPKLNEGSPMRISAVHHCCSPEVWEEQQALLKAACSNSLQVRFRVHRGTVKECLGVLQGHGIDPTSIPVNETGEMMDPQEERRKLEEQRLYERLNFPLRNTIHVPFSQDVLLGKGAPYQNHPGNRNLRQLVADHIKHYDKSHRAGKKEIALGIIGAIRQKGGLFLKQDGGKWCRVDDDVARLKVTAAFRTHRHQSKQSDN